VQRPVLVGGLVFGLLVLGLAVHRGEVLVVALPWLVYLAAGLLFGPGPLQMEVVRTLGVDMILPGQPVDVRVLITNGGSHLEEVLIEDVIAPPVAPVQGEACVLTALPPGQTVELRYTLSVQRGYYRFEGVRVQARDRFGLLQRQTVLPAPGRFFVLPHSIKLRRVSIRPNRTRAVAGPILARQGGPGVDFFNVREYHSGDPLHHVNWKVTARAEHLIFSNEYEQERAADVGLILDVRRRAYFRAAGDPIFEHAVLAAASLAETLLSAGNRVGLLLYGMLLDWTFPGYGKIQRQRILQALARAQLGDSMVFDRLEYIPARLFPPQSQLVVVSPLVDGDVEPLATLRRRGYTVLVVSPNPVPAEAAAWDGESSLPWATRLARIERAQLIRDLRQAGIRVLDWNVETPFEQAVYAELGRAPLWLRAIGIGL
jgi:uncharacterized protein (DUF58 family)